MSYATGDSLRVRIRVAFGASIAANPNTWAWTDVTAWWHVDDEVTIVWGRSSGAEQAETSTMTLALKNTDGRFTAYDPRSPYWPNVRKWTPISYDIDLGDGAGWRNKFSGFIRRWPLTWPGASALMALARIEAVGVLGRLGRGNPPARSTLRRTIGATAPAAYYPAEDGVLAGSASSAVAGQAPLVISGLVEFNGNYETGAYRIGTAALADLSAGGSLSVQLGRGVAAATSSKWTVHTYGNFDVDYSPGDITIMEWTTGGTFVRWRLVEVKATLRTQIIAYTADGASTMVIDRSGVIGGYRAWAVSAEQVGGTINVTYWLSNRTAALTGSVAGTLGGVASMRVNASNTTATQPMPFGHLAVWAAAKIPYDTDVVADPYGAQPYGATLSYWGEAAHLRLARLCAEDVVPLAMPAVPAEAVVRMGWQPVATPLELYQQVEDADQGLIYESGFGLGYLPRASRYNAPVALTIDAAKGQLGMPFEPVDDDQLLRNRWTVERQDGASAVADDPDSIDVQGEIEGSATVNLATDDPLPNHASWRLRLSTVPEPRYPSLPINLGAHPTLAAAWCACKPGSRVQVLNPPRQAVPGIVDQLVVGATEVYRGRRSWKATLNVVPASPWTVFVLGDRVYGRLDTSGSALAVDAAATDTTLLVATVSPGRRWITTAERPQDLPIMVSVGGIPVKVTAISGTASPQAFTLAAPLGYALRAGVGVRISKQEVPA